MTNDLLQIKLRQRLNKLSSNDFDNLECWQIIEAFNKSQLQWCRRQLHGMNQYKEGDEGSQRRVDDLNILLASSNILDVYLSPIVLLIDEFLSNSVISGKFFNM